MPSEKRARELADLEPPRSIERIIRFLQDISPLERPRLTQFTGVATTIGSLGLAAEMFAERVVFGLSRFEQAPPSSETLDLIERNGLRISDVREFMDWLVRWNDKRTETEVLTPLEFITLNRTSDEVMELIRAGEVAKASEQVFGRGTARVGEPDPRSGSRILAGPRTEVAANNLPGIPPGQQFLKDLNRLVWAGNYAIGTGAALGVASSATPSWTGTVPNAAASLGSAANRLPTFGSLSLTSAPAGSTFPGGPDVDINVAPRPSAQGGQPHNYGFPRQVDRGQGASFESPTFEPNQSQRQANAVREQISQSWEPPAQSTAQDFRLIEQNPVGPTFAQYAPTIPSEAIPPTADINTVRLPSAIDGAQHGSFAVSTVSGVEDARARFPWLPILGTVAGLDLLSEYLGSHRDGSQTEERSTRFSRLPFVGSAGGGLEFPRDTFADGESGNGVSINLNRQGRWAGEFRTTDRQGMGDTFGQPYDQVVGSRNFEKSNFGRTQNGARPEITSNPFLWRGLGPASETGSNSAAGSDLAGASPSLFTPSLDISPEMGMISLVAPPIQVASQDSEKSGSAVSFDWQALAKGSGPLDESGIQQLRRVLPASASLIYPALPKSDLGSGAVNLPLAGSTLARLLQTGYGNVDPDVADSAATAGRTASSLSSGSLALPGSIVPTKPPIGSSTSGILGDSPSKGVSGSLGEAGSGMAKSGGALGFLGMPVRLAPSLGGRADLGQQVEVRKAVDSHGTPGLTRPDQFGLLRDRMFPKVNSIQAEPDVKAWSKAAPAFGLRDTDPLTLLSPDSRIKPIPASQPLPSALARISPMIPTSGSTLGQHLGSTSSSPSLLSGRSPSAPSVGRAHPFSIPSTMPVGTGTNHADLFGANPPGSNRMSFPSAAPGLSGMPMTGSMGIPEAGRSSILGAIPPGMFSGGTSGSAGNISPSFHTSAPHTSAPNHRLDVPILDFGDERSPRMGMQGGPSPFAFNQNPIGLGARSHSQPTSQRPWRPHSFGAESRPSTSDPSTVSNRGRGGRLPFELPSGNVPHTSPARPYSGMIGLPSANLAPATVLGSNFPGFDLRMPSTRNQPSGSSGTGFASPIFNGTRTPSSATAPVSSRQRFETPNIGSEIMARQGSGHPQMDAGHFPDIQVRPGFDMDRLPVRHPAYAVRVAQAAGANPQAPSIHIHGSASSTSSPNPPLATASLRPTMSFPRMIQRSQAGTTAIQTFTSGPSTGSSPATKPTTTGKSNSKKREERAATEVNVMANEVWSILKRKLAAEADRRGRH